MTVRFTRIQCEIRVVEFSKFFDSDFVSLEVSRRNRPDTVCLLQVRATTMPPTEVLETGRRHDGVIRFDPKPSPRSAKKKKVPGKSPWSYEIGIEKKRRILHPPDIQTRHASRGTQSHVGVSMTTVGGLVIDGRIASDTWRQPRRKNLAGYPWRSRTRDLAYRNVRRLRWEDQS